MQLTAIDYGDMSSGPGLSKLDEVCREWGFFELRNPPITQELREQMLEEMATFFSLPPEKKRGCERTSKNHWGYYDRELTKNVQDWKELFDVGPRVGSCVPQWPQDLPLFRQVTEVYSRRCEAIALQLVRCIARALGANGDALAKGFENHTSYLRMNHYPVCEDPAPADTPTGGSNGHLGISHHSDAGAVTVLLQDGNPGLQVERNGQWHTVSAERGALIINIGDVVQVWSNDRYRAPLHRVLASKTQTRLSAPFFLNPAFEMNYAPLPSVRGQGPARYRSINWGEFRSGRAAGDYADVGEEIQISHFRLPGN